jgi:hypothetical protein
LDDFFHFFLETQNKTQAKDLWGGNQEESSHLGPPAVGRRMKREAEDEGNSKEGTTFARLFLSRGKRRRTDGDANDDNAAAVGDAARPGQPRSPPSTNSPPDQVSVDTQAPPPAFVGFTTGSGRKLAPPKASVEQAMKRFLNDDHDDDKDDLPQPEQSPPPAFVGFTTGSGRKLAPPKASVEQAMKRFLDDDDGDNNSNDDGTTHPTRLPQPNQSPPPAFVGFTTGSGRKLAPPKASVEQAMKRFLDDDGGDGDDDGHLGGAQAAAGAMFGGFTTGSGKKLEPPKASVEQAMKRFLDDDDDEGDLTTTTSTTTQHSNARLPPHHQPPPGGGGGGFTTARGRTLDPPRASVERAMRRMLEDNDDGSKVQDVATDKQNVTLSRQEEGSETLESGPPPSASFGGFKTVSGKAIQVSAAALVRSRQLLADDEDDDNDSRNDASVLERAFASPAPAPRCASSNSREDDEDDADMLLELSTCAEDESASAPLRSPSSPPASKAVAPASRSLLIRPPLGPLASSASSTTSPTPVLTSPFAYPASSVRSTPPRPTPTPTTTFTPRAASDPPRVVITPTPHPTTPSASTTGYLSMCPPSAFQLAATL